ncbi:hypothetical protein WKV44_00265 [Spirochaetia bacterium 38H-sp]|uniref:Protein kinase domain-containing protein n=1 Tax=Rarispira pelagica TaxID=3141764 RepID=A0ABU9U8H5_9SPIR
MSTVLRLVEIDGKKRLAVPTGIHENTAALARQFAMCDKKAWRVIDGAVHPFDCIALRKLEGELMMLFPEDVPRFTLRELAAMPGNMRLSHLTSLASALVALTEQGIDPGKANPDAVFFTEDGVVFMGQALSAVLESHAERIHQEPDWLDDIDSTSWSFALAYMCYQAITGRLPFPGNTRQERLFARERGYLIGLSASSDSSRAFVVWMERALKLPGMFVSPPPFPENLCEDIEITESPKVVEKFAERRYKLSRSVAKYGLTVAVSVVVLIFLVAILTPMIRAATRPPITIGMEPEEVVTLYYESLDKMDLETMGDCLASKKDPAYIMITNMYVTSRVRTAVEKHTPILSPNVWKAYNMPEMENGSYIFGISNLKTKTIRKGNDTAVIQADYVFWTIDIPQEELVEPEQITKKITEKLVLEKHDNRWVINSHKPTAEKLISFDEAKKMLAEDKSVKYDLRK